MKQGGEPQEREMQKRVSLGIRALFPFKTVTWGSQSGLSKPARGREPGWPWGTDNCSLPVEQSRLLPPQWAEVGLPETTSLPGLSWVWAPTTHGELYSSQASQGVGGRLPEDGESGALGQKIKADSWLQP